MRTIGISEEKGWKRKGQDSDNHEDKKEDKPRRSDDPLKLHYKNYTQLSEPQPYILVAIERTDLLKFPKGMNRPMGKDRNAHYIFHKTYEHNIDRCWDLMIQIESLIRNRRLQRYIKIEDRDRKRHKERVERRDWWMDERQDGDWGR